MKSYPILVEKLTTDFDVDPAVITPDATLTDLGLDSLSVVEFVFEIEEELEIELDLDDADFETVGEAAALADRLLAEKENGAR